MEIFEIKVRHDGRTKETVLELEEMEVSRTLVGKS